MSELDDILDGSALNKKGHVLYSIPPDMKLAIKNLFLKLMKESMPQGSYHVNTNDLTKRVTDL